MTSSRRISPKAKSTLRDLLDGDGFPWRDFLKAIEPIGNIHLSLTFEYGFVFLNLDDIGAESLATLRKAAE